MVSAGGSLLFGFLLGLTLVVPPGPMNALIALRAARSVWAGVLTGLGALTADLILGTLTYLLRSAVDLGSVARYLYLVGAGVMALFGSLALLARDEPDAPRVDVRAAVYASALGVGLSNPFQIVWWFTAGLAYAYFGGLVLLVGLFAAVLVWVVSFPALLHAGVERYPRLRPAVRWASALLMFGLAGYFVWLAR